MATEEQDLKLNPVILRDEVYDLLRNRIMSLKYPPNFRFDLSALESQLGISRTPLKEALQRLEAEGLIDIRPRRGTFVTGFDPQDIAESYDVRRILECAAAEALIAYVTEADVEQLHKTNDQMLSLLEQDDYQSILQEYLDLDREFHRYFVQLTQNSKLSAVHAQINTHLHVARLRARFARTDSRGTQSEHDAILAALDVRDVDALVEAMANHLTLSKDRTLDALRDE